MRCPVLETGLADRGTEMHHVVKGSTIDSISISDGVLDAKSMLSRSEE